MCWIVILITVICSAEAAPVRLHKGTTSATSLSGSVQVLYGNVWMSVCADGWNSNEAKVVCISFGDYPVAVALPTVLWNYDNNYVAVIECSGMESDISQCNVSTTYSCRQRSLAGVLCNRDAPILRLADGHVAKASASGRVEVYYNGSWGSICDDDWDDVDARVVCNMLGYPYEGAVAMPRAHFGHGEGQILLDEVACTGNETSIFECRNDGWNKHDCSHSEDAGVECRHALNATLTVALTHGHVSDSFVSGRVEVRSAGVRGTVCDDYWDTLDASVVCRMLGLPFQNAVALSENAFGSGDVDFLLDDVHCVGNETSLAQCRRRSWGDHNCDTSETAGVICHFYTGGTESVRLVGGFSTSGTVEVLHSGQWGNVGDTAWDDRDAIVVCRMLGLPTENATAQVGAHHGHGRFPTILDTVRCKGNESSLFHCPHSLPVNPDYHIHDVAGVNCDAGTSDNVSVRLVNGQFSKDSVSGRVEVLHQGQWGTVCHNGWDDNDAKVVCRMLGYPNSAARGKWLAFFGEGSSEILLNHVRCLGDESSLSLCSHSGWGNHNCIHAYDAGVVCQEDEETSIQVKLVGGQVDGAIGYGRLEVLYNGEWGTVCDSNWDAKESGVVCRMAGFSTPLDLEFENLTLSNLPVAFHGMYCRGNETNLLKCRHFTSRSPSAGCFADSKPADVSCYSEFSIPVFVRLEDGLATDCSWSGRVEVYQNGQWLAVCSDDWGQNETSTLCRTFGYVHGDEAVGEAADSRHATMYQAECSGVENNIQHCRGVVLNASQCTSGQHVRITCLKENGTNGSDEPGLTVSNETRTYDSSADEGRSYWSNDAYRTENTRMSPMTRETDTSRGSEELQTSRASPRTESEASYATNTPPNDYDTTTSAKTVKPQQTTPDVETKKPQTKKPEIGSKDKTDIDINIGKKNVNPGTKEYLTGSQDNDVVIAVVVPLAVVVILAVLVFFVYRRVRQSHTGRLRNVPGKHECDVGYIPEKPDCGDDGYINPVYEKQNDGDDTDPMYSVLDVDKEDDHTSINTARLVINDGETH